MSTYLYLYLYNNNISNKKIVPTLAMPLRKNNFYISAKIIVIKVRQMKTKTIKNTLVTTKQPKWRKH